MTTINRQTLSLERQTKGAVLYSTKNSSDGLPPTLTTSIYLRKTGFPTTNYPALITVTVETDEDIGS